MSEPALGRCPLPDRQSAAQAAKTLLDGRLIVCANILPSILSIYDWNGERGEGEEAGMLIKTDATLLAGTIAQLAELYPYEQPAILGWRCGATTSATAAWPGSLRG